MTIPELEKIIKDNQDAAEQGCVEAQGQVIQAQAAIDDLKCHYHFRSWNHLDDREWRSRERNA